MDSSTASPEVLRSLQADYVRQVRAHVLGWTAVAAAAVVLWALSGFLFIGPLWFLIGMSVAQAVRRAREWSRERRVDAVAEASAEGIAARERAQADISAFNERVRARTPIATGTLAVIVIAVTATEWLTAGSTVLAVGRAGLVKQLVSNGEWWRLVTSTFLHANIVHLWANITALVVFGRLVEALTPRPLLFLTYITAGISGSLASWWLMPNTPSLGASGAIMGLVGFVVVLGWKRPDDVPPTVREAALMTIALTGMIGAVMFGNIDNAAHAGGAIAGALVALVAVPRSRPWSITPSVSLKAIGAVSIVAIVFGAGRTVMALTAGPTMIGQLVPSDRTPARPVLSVSVMVQNDRGDWSVLVGNNDPRRTLEAYQFTIGEPAINGKVVWRDDCCIASDETAPVPPGRSVHFTIGSMAPPAPIDAHPRIDVVLFDDGSFEGSASAREQMIDLRRLTLAEVDFWIREIDAARSLPPAKGAARLKNAMAGRAHGSEVSKQAMAAFRLQRLSDAMDTDQQRVAPTTSEIKSELQKAAQALQKRIK